MSSDLILAVTVGQRDLQVLAMGPSGLERLSVRREDLGALHRALLDAVIPYRLWVPDGAALPRESRSVEAGYQDGQVRIPAESYRLASSADLQGAATETAPVLWMIPGLLGEAAPTLAREVQAGGLAVRRVLLFHTDRGPADPRSAREPVAAAPLLGTWLAELLALPEADVCRVQCLGAGEELTVRDQAGNTSLLPRAAERIDGALRQASRDFPEATLRLHVAGGIPALSEVVQASAQLRFASIQYHNPSEDRSSRQAPTLRFTMVEALHARRQACELVRGGEYLAAAVLARRFASAGRMGVWERCLQAVARYFQGYMNDARSFAKDLRGTLTGSALLRLLDEKVPHALHVGMRAEASLHSADVLMASSQTATFLDVAMLDAVDATLRANRGTPCITWEKREILRDELRPHLAEIQAAANVVRRGTPWLQPFRAGEVTDWYHDHSSLRAHQLWQKYVLIQLIRDVAGRADLAEALDGYCEALNRKRGDHRPADLRNRIIHSLPQQPEVETAVRLFEADDVRLWFREGTRSASFLHPTARAAAILAAFRQADALRQYEKLIEGLLADIQICPLDGAG